MMFILAAGLAILPAFCMTQVIPTAPGPGQSFKAGADCTIAWQPDATGTWKSFKIDLMSGSNNNMSIVTNVVSGLDGTSSSAFTWMCPKVDPYSAIYFYQFSQQGQHATSSPAWTTRFTITSLSGTTTPPQYQTQPNGDAIPWGVGQVADIQPSTSNGPTPTASDPNTDPSTSNDPTSMASDANTDQAVPSHTEIPAGSKAGDTPPEVTMNVPTPKLAGKHARREGFMTIYTGEPQASGLPRRRSATA